MTTERAAMARTYSYAGWKVFPLKPDSKLPIIPSAHPEGDPLRGTCRGGCGRLGHGLWDATDDLDVIAGWWERWPDANIGIPVGGNDLAVLDVDPVHGGDQSYRRLVSAMADVGSPMPATLTQITGSGGVHYMFTAPEGGIKNVSKAFGPDLPGLDTRGRGGYIVAAPSGHPSGGRYKWVDFFADTAPWPNILTELMDWRTSEPPAAGRDQFANPLDPPGGAGYGEAALRGELERIRLATEGTRNDALNRAAFALGQLVADGKLNERTVRDELVVAGTAAGLTFTESVKTVNSGLRGGAQKPRAA